jgi:hypothetical protein
MSVATWASIGALLTGAIGALATLINWFRARQVLIRAQQNSVSSTEVPLPDTSFDLLRGPQSRIDAVETEAVAAMINSLKNVPEAVVQVGSILLIKTDGTVVARSLSVKELRYLETHRALLKNPQAILGALNDPGTPFSGRPSVTSRIISSSNS